MIQQAMEAELQELLGEYAQRRTEDGRAGDFSFGLGTALCEQDEVAGGGIAVLVFEMR